MPWALEGYGILQDSVVGRACIPAGLRGGWFEDFAAGMGVGVLLSVVVFPQSTIMKRLHAQKGGPHVRMTTELRSFIAQRGGVLPLYCGLPMFMARTAMAWGVTNSCYAQLKKTFHPER